MIYSFFRQFKNASKHHSPSPNPTASTDMERHQTGDMQPPSTLATHATRKTTRFSVRDAKSKTAGAMYRASMGATESQSNWPEMCKTLG